MLTQPKRTKRTKRTNQANVCGHPYSLQIRSHVSKSGKPSSSSVCIGFRGRSERPVGHIHQPDYEAAALKTPG